MRLWLKYKLKPADKSSCKVCTIFKFNINFR